MIYFYLDNIDSKKILLIINNELKNKYKIISIVVFKGIIKV